MDLKPFCLLLLAVSLTACIYTDRSDNYQKASSIKPLEVPGNESLVAEPLYPIPEIRVRYDAFYDVVEDGFEVPRPEPLSAEREATKVRIQKVGNRQWILLEAPASQVWPLAQSFLSRSGLEVKKSVPSTGLIETHWLSFKSDSESKSQFRIRIEKGVRPETTEIHILHHQAAMNETPSDWPESSSSNERESWLLQEMANTLAVDIENKAASLLGQSVGGEVKAELLLEGGEPTIRLLLDQERAKATVKYALTKENFLLWGEKSEHGVYYAQFLDENEQRNWFVRAFKGKTKYQVKKAPMDLASILSGLNDSASVKQTFAGIPGVAFGNSNPDVGFFILLTKRERDVLVKVRDSRGLSPEPKVQKRLLSVLRRNLI